MLTIVGLALFSYLVYSVGLGELLDGIARFGFLGFGLILALYFAKICVRAYAWKLSVHDANALRIKDTVPAVIIGEALSSTVPLGILISGTSKAVAVRHRIPLVQGLSSVATENLFYSLATGLFLIAGAAILLAVSASSAELSTTVGSIIVTLSILIGLGILMVVRQWHFASALCNAVYNMGFLRRILENGRRHVRRFEDLIYGFYRQYPGRFVPIFILECCFHALGVTETYLILSRLTDSSGQFVSGFLLESVSRLVTIVFKLIPFSIGVDEAGAEIIGGTIALAAGVGVTLAIIRKARILFWAAIGWTLILKREISLAELTSTAQNEI